MNLLDPKVVAGGIALGALGLWGALAALGIAPAPATKGDIYEVQAEINGVEEKTRELGIDVYEQAIRDKVITKGELETRRQSTGGSIPDAFVDQQRALIDREINTFEQKLREYRQRKLQLEQGR